MPHSILFSGPSGNGKTSLARLLAKKLNVSSTNLIEINAASSRGIDTIREIEELVSLPSVIGGNRLIIFDEVHELTTSAQQALLKIVEDVPPYQYYIFCTTEPNKIIPTLRNRFDHFRLKSLSNKEILKLLVNVGKRAELKKPTETVLRAIVEESKGCARTALILLEKQIGLNEKEALNVIRSFVPDEEEHSEVIELCRKLVNGSLQDVVNIYKRLDLNNIFSIRKVILSYFHSMLLSQSKVTEVIKSIDILKEYNLEDLDKAGLLTCIYKIKRIF